MSASNEGGPYTRENSMAWALYTATPGEDPQMILARASLYEDYVLSASGNLERGRPDKVFDPHKAVSDCLQGH